MGRCSGAPWHSARTPSSGRAGSFRGGAPIHSGTRPPLRRLPEYIGLHQMIPAAGPAHLDDMNRELFSGLGQAHQLFRAARRTRDRPQAVAVDPGYESELFLPADRACDLAPPAVKFGRTQQVGIGVTYLGDIDTARIDVSQQRLAPERIVHHLPLNSHAPRVAVLYCCRPRPDWIRVDGLVETAPAIRTGSTSSGTSECGAKTGVGAAVRAGSAPCRAIGAFAPMASGRLGR